MYPRGSSRLAKQAVTGYTGDLETLFYSGLFIIPISILILFIFKKELSQYFLDPKKYKGPNQ
jgi:hypothetical protein